MGNQPDKLQGMLYDQFQDYQPEPDAAVWDAIQMEIAADRPVWYRRAIVWAPLATAAACLALALLFMPEMKLDRTFDGRMAMAPSISQPASTHAQQAAEVVPESPRPKAIPQTTRKTVAPPQDQMASADLPPSTQSSDRSLSFGKSTPSFSDQVDSWTSNVVPVSTSASSPEALESPAVAEAETVAPIEEIAAIEPQSRKTLSEAAMDVVSRELNEWDKSPVNIQTTQHSQGTSKTLKVSLGGLTITRKRHKRVALK
ncbi:hypothetical protein [Pontibacter sp. G13]|uniref:hypothetical protein n=1 Tax=Pontibacter sp. G13 TaxID=3074898 RepID=UPI00288C2FAF|nr:hypothetical protein [Pontibacter sp. G13]WNJ16155.1 hypothetical protein RJD25_14930 [Pontibacter sp. G13]